MDAQAIINFIKTEYPDVWKSSEITIADCINIANAYALSEAPTQISDKLRTLDQMTDEEAIKIAKMSLCNIQGEPEFKVFKKDEENYNLGFDDGIIVGYRKKRNYHYCIIDELFDVTVGYFRTYDSQSWYANQRNFNETTLYLIQQGFVGSISKAGEPKEAEPMFGKLNLPPIKRKSKEGWISVEDRLPTKEDANKNGEILALFEDDLELTVQYEDSGIGGVIIKWQPLS